MSREAIALSQRFFVRSALEAELARLDAPRGDADRVGVLTSWSIREREEGARAPLREAPGRHYLEMAEHLYREIVVASDAAQGSLPEPVGRARGGQLASALALESELVG